MTKIHQVVIVQVSFQNHSDDCLPKKHAVLKLGEKLNPRKRRVDTNIHEVEHNLKRTKKPLRASPPTNRPSPSMDKIQKIEDSDKKRIESLKRKRREYQEQQLIIKSGLGGVVSLLLTICSIN